MSERIEAWLFLLQRMSAMALAPFVLVHLMVMMVAVHGGLSASEILGRTQGSLLWGLFYGLFVVAVSIHAPIGVRNLLREWTPLRPSLALACSVMFGLVLLVLGLRAVYGVVA